MKIIFLDIDGVLNNELWYEHLVETCQPTCHFCPDNIVRLNEITDHTKAKIVVSSSWRTGRSVKELQTLLADHGVTGEVIDKTPRLRWDKETGKPIISVFRGNEIHAWMQANKDKLGESIGKYKDYLILDDDTDMLYWQRNNFIKIPSRFGICDRHVSEALRIFNRRK